MGKSSELTLGYLLVPRWLTTCGTNGVHQQSQKYSRYSMLKHGIAVIFNNLAFYKLRSNSIPVKDMDTLGYKLIYIRLYLSVSISLYKSILQEHRQSQGLWLCQGLYAQVLESICTWTRPCPTPDFTGVGYAHPLFTARSERQQVLASSPLSSVGIPLSLRIIPCKPRSLFTVDVSCSQPQHAN